MPDKKEIALTLDEFIDILKALIEAKRMIKAISYAEKYLSLKSPEAYRYIKSLETEIKNDR
jgi:hypothetical protein